MKLYLETGVLLILSRPGALRQSWGDWLEGRLRDGDELFSSAFALLELERCLGREGRSQVFPVLLEDLEALLEGIMPLRAVELRRAFNPGTADQLAPAQARHAAIAFENEMAAIVSPDPAYDRAPGLERLAPEF